MAYNLGLIHSSLEELRNEWDDHFQEQNSERAQYETSIRQLDKDWDFLKMFVESIRKWSDAYIVLQNSGRRESLILKIEVVATEIGEDLNSCCAYGKNYSTMPHELLNLIGDCQRKTDEQLKREIVEAVEYLSDTTFTVYSNSPDYIFWTEFVDSVRQNLQLIEDFEDGFLDKQIYALCNELKLIQRYLQGVHGSLLFHADSRHVNYDAFLTHVASVVLRIAIQSCNLWFNRTDPLTAKIKAIGLVYLHHKIDLTNPEFFDLNLRFQQVIYKNYHIDFCVADFCSYILVWSSNKDLEKVLHSLVSYLINCKLEADFSGEDVHLCSQEVKAVLAEAAFLHDAMRKEKNTCHLPPPCSELLTKCFLLQADLFIMKQLKGRI